MASHVFHWKHGWIPLNHAAVLKKAHGDSGMAQSMLAAARGDSAHIRSRGDVAHALRDLPSVPQSQRLEAKHQIIAAAHLVGAVDLLPSSWQHIRPGLDARAHL